MENASLYVYQIAILSKCRVHFFLQGYLINADGNKFNVSFEHNMKNGFGIWTLPDGKGRIEGTWTHGSLEGFVMMFLPDGKKCSNKYLKDKETEEWSCT